MYTREQIEKAVLQKGYKWFTGVNYDVNIVGIRKDAGNKVTNSFDDQITVSYRDESGNWHFESFAVTTDPGIYWMNNLLNEYGTAILVPGQYRGAYKVGKHQGRYLALVQHKPVKVYRDDNEDGYYDRRSDKIQTGMFGINIHRASESRTSTQVDKWSAGCQVFANPDNFDRFLEIVQKASKVWGNSFTYTLLEEQDLG